MTDPNPSHSNEERRFLHDIASPLGAAMFLVDILLENAQNRVGVNPEEVTQLFQAYKALEKIRVILQERRELLVKRGSQK